MKGGELQHGTWCVCAAALLLCPQGPVAPPLLSGKLQQGIANIVTSDKGHTAP